jgi:hypothetical protein
MTTAKNFRRGNVMSHPIALKDEPTTRLRQKILLRLSQAQETDRADDGLSTLSFQSKLYPDRHTWIDTDGELIQIDLEDWQDEQEWDNAVARVTVPSGEVAIALLSDWFMGNSLENYANLNQTYDLLTPRFATV